MNSGDRTFTRRAGDLEAPLTQLVADREAYLGGDRHDVGRRISETQVELFISTDVAGALQQEFGYHAPAFVAVHDVGTAASLRLIGSLAGAVASKVQELTVRRQGHGVALAVLQFIEATFGDGPPVRIYATDLNADTATRTQVARVLLAHSTLGVLLVGELPPHALSSQLAPLGEALQRGPWPNRELMMVPLGSGTALATQASQLAGHSTVAVRVTPHANKPRQVWNFIGGAWARLHAEAGVERPLPAATPATLPRPQTAAAAAAQPLALQPLQLLQPSLPVPPVRPARAPAPAGAAPTTWQAYADRCAQVKGALGCCVFDLHSMRPLAHAGDAPAADRLAQHGSVLLGAMHDATRSLGLGGGHSEASISTGSHHLLLRPVPGHPGVAVHLVLAAAAGNLTLARMQLERIEAPA